MNAYLCEAKTPNEQLSLYDAAAQGEENPYRGLLALADHFVVTMDSLSMMVEVASLARPLSIFPLEREALGLEAALAAMGLLRHLDPRREEIPAGGVLPRTLAALGWPIHSRDLSAIARLLVRESLASWLGDPVIAPVGYRDPGLERAAQRVRALLAI